MVLMAGIFQHLRGAPKGANSAYAWLQPLMHKGLDPRETWILNTMSCGPLAGDVQVHSELLELTCGTRRETRCVYTENRCANAQHVCFQG
jgi:hypothetical protein